MLSNPGSLVTEHETGEPSQQYDPLIFQQAVLVPPSYFKATVTSAQAERERTAAAAASPASTFVLSPRDNTRLLHHKKEEEEEEIAALRLQNQALRCGVFHSFFLPLWRSEYAGYIHVPF